MLLPDFPVQGVPTTARAELVQLQPLRIVSPVLTAVVSALTALITA